jgi:hypothetical protein
MYFLFSAYFLQESVVGRKNLKNGCFKGEIFDLQKGHIGYKN